VTAPIHILNGLNLNRLGTRETRNLRVHHAGLDRGLYREAADPRAVVFRQSNAEHQIIDWIQQAIDEGAGALIINPAGLTLPPCRSWTR